MFTLMIYVVASPYIVIGVAAKFRWGWWSFVATRCRPGGSLVHDTTFASILLCIYIEKHDFHVYESASTDLTVLVDPFTRQLIRSPYTSVFLLTRTYLCDLAGTRSDASGVSSLVLDISMTRESHA